MRSSVGAAGGRKRCHSEKEKEKMGEQKPLVSVIIPCYNAELYIEQAIRSFAENTISRMCELIVVNDGSKDRTKEIVETLIGEYPEHRIVCVEIPNSGVSAARNRGISEARGKYVTFLDADDMYAGHYLEALVSGIRKTKADICLCCWTSSQDDLTREKVAATEIPKRKAMDILLYREKPVAVWSMLYRRKIILDSGARFPVGIKYGEDIEFIWKYILACEKCAFVKAKYYFYRPAPNSAMHRVTWEKTEILDAVDHIIEKMKESDPEYVDRFESYMVSRKIIALQKDFAISGSREYFRRLESRSDRKKTLSVAGKGKLPVRLAGLTYSVSPRLFYLFFNGLSGLRKKKE